MSFPQGKGSSRSSSVDADSIEDSKLRGESIKTFLVASELAASFEGQTEDGSLLDLNSITSQAAQEVSDSEWLKLTAPLKAWQISYPLDSAEFRGELKWEDDDRVFQLAEAMCWTGKEVGSSPCLKVNLIFKSYTLDFEIRLECINNSIYQEPVTYAETVKVLPDSEGKWDFHCEAVSTSIMNAGWKWKESTLDWLTLDIMSQYRELIKRLVSAALLKMANRRNEDY